VRRITLVVCSVGFLLLSFGSALALGYDVTLDFEGVPDLYIGNWAFGNQNLGDYYASDGFLFGPDVTVLDRSRHWYNDTGYPPHSGTSVIWCDSYEYLDITFTAPAYALDAWYTLGYPTDPSDRTIVLEAYDKDGNVLDTATGPGNSKNGLQGTTSPIGVSDPLGRIASVQFRDPLHTRGSFTLDDVHANITPELPPGALGLLSFVPYGIWRLRRRKA